MTRRCEADMGKSSRNLGTGQWNLKGDAYQGSEVVG